ncbi:hypothetical protein Tsubulata_041231, partial [Turnera subulata]
KRKCRALTKSTKQPSAPELHPPEVTESIGQACDEQPPSESAQNHCAAASPVADLEAVSNADSEVVTVASTPPPWIKSLADDADGTRLIKLSEASKLEGSPVPQDLADPVMTNYEYLINMIGSLKKELKQKVR